MTTDLSRGKPKSVCDHVTIALALLWCAGIYGLLGCAAFYIFPQFWPLGLVFGILTAAGVIITTRQFINEYRPIRQNDEPLGSMGHAEVQTVRSR